MALDLQRAAQRRMRLIVIALCGLVIVLVGVVLALTVGGDSAGEPAGTPPAEEQPSNGGDDAGDSAQPGPSETIEAPGPGSFEAPERWVVLPEGSDEGPGGLPVGFPKTPQGAAAVVVSAGVNGWTLDAQQLRDGVNAYSIERDREQLLSMAEPGVDELRQYMGLPADGALPPGADVHAWPLGVQWEETGPDSYTVHLLVRVNFTSGAEEEMRTELHTTENRVVWVDGDWKALLFSDADGPPPLADIGSKEFNEAGWIAVEGAE